MTTKFGNKATFRETDDTLIRDGSRSVQVVVGLEPGDVISVRLKGTKQKLAVTASWLYGQAMKREGERLLYEKLNK